MVVYIPNAIYDECKMNNETMEDFIREVFKEWVDEYLVATTIIERAIKQIIIIDEKFGT